MTGGSELPLRSLRRASYPQLHRVQHPNTEAGGTSSRPQWESFDPKEWELFSPNRHSSTKRGPSPTWPLCAAEPKPSVSKSATDNRPAVGDRGRTRARFSTAQFGLSRYDERDEADRNGMNGAGSVADRLAPLSERLASSRQSARERYGRFFTALGARMEGARAVENELDRLLARRFNALDYLRTDELGLSRIVGDLLDPGGTHGQGTGFLARFEDLVGPDRWPADQTVRHDDFEVNVLRERSTDGGGRLDISVELRSQGREPACIALENKPYAADGEAQVADYPAVTRSDK